MPSELSALCSELGRQRLHDHHEVEATEVCNLCGNSGRRQVGLHPETCQPRYEPCVCVLERAD